MLSLTIQEKIDEINNYIASIQFFFFVMHGSLNTNFFGLIIIQE